MNSPRHGLAKLFRRPPPREQLPRTSVDGVLRLGGGGLTFDAGTGTTSQPRWYDTDGTLIGVITVYNVAGVVLVSLEGASANASTVGKAQILGGRVNKDKYAYIEVDSNGLVLVNLQSGAVLTNSAQQMEIQSKTSDTGNPQTVATLTANPSSAHAAGFGARLYLQADGSFQGSVQGRFTGAGATADLQVQAQNSVKFVQGATPSITGSRGGNAALASLLTALATAGLIVDNTT